MENLTEEQLAAQWNADVNYNENLRPVKYNQTAINAASADYEDLLNESRCFVRSQNAQSR